MIDSQTRGVNVPDIIANNPAIFWKIATGITFKSLAEQRLNLNASNDVEPGSVKANIQTACPCEKRKGLQIVVLKCLLCRQQYINLKNQ